MSSGPLDKHKSIDLISYHNDGKVRTVMGRGRKSLSEYSRKCMDMREDNLLIFGIMPVILVK